jgi:hypothetical protein
MERTVKAIKDTFVISEIEHIEELSTGALIVHYKSGNTIIRDRKDMGAVHQGLRDLMEAKGIQQTQLDWAE